MSRLQTWRAEHARVRVRVQMQRSQRRLGLEDRLSFDRFLDLTLDDVRVLTRRVR